MYTIAICSPYRQEADTLRMSVHNILDKMKIAHVIYYYKDSSSLQKTLKKYPEKYNLLFLDTALSPKNGVDLARGLRKGNYTYPIVLLSDTMNYIFDGYDVEACQYFIKPVEEDKLHRLFFRLSVKALQHSSQNLLLNFGSSHYKISYADILYIETAGRKVAIHTKTDVIYYPCKLSDMEELLPSSLFVRCHQSFLLQLLAIDHITKALAILKDGTEIPISRSYKETVQNIFCT